MNTQRSWDQKKQKSCIKEKEYIQNGRQRPIQKKYKNINQNMKDSYNKMTFLKPRDVTYLKSKVLSCNCGHPRCRGKFIPKDKRQTSCIFAMEKKENQSYPQVKYCIIIYL